MARILLQVFLIVIIYISMLFGWGLGVYMERTGLNHGLDDRYFSMNWQRGYAIFVVILAVAYSILLYLFW